MPKRIPTKLPTVTGEGPTAQGFKLAFDRINEILDYLESLQPRPSANGYVEHTDIGVVHRPNLKAAETSDDEDTEARWA